jgi:hypothetical protein
VSDFFEEVDSLGIVEDHVKAALRLEEEQARKLLRRYREVRMQLRDRLDRFEEGTFSAQQARGVMVQVDAAISAMSLSLKGGMSEAALETALKGVEHEIEELEKFEKHFRGAVVPINLNAQIVAQESSNFLINRYESSIDAYSEDLRSNLMMQLSNEMLAESSLSKVVKNLGLFFQGEEWKLHRIARTELHHVYNVGKLNSLKYVKETTLPDIKKALYHPMDSRTAADSKLAAQMNLIVPVDQPFRYRWKGDWREFMVPPDRPNDRSIMIPYRQVWDS